MPDRMLGDTPWVMSYAELQRVTRKGLTGEVEPFASARAAVLVIQRDKAPPREPHRDPEGASTMRTSRLAALVAATAAMASVTALGSGSAAADAPPPTWDAARDRTLTCDTGTVEGQWARGGPFTAFLIKNSTDVIVAKWAIVTLPDGSVYTPPLAPGFDESKADTHCTYTDPAGLYIELWGLRS